MAGESSCKGKSSPFIPTVLYSTLELEQLAHILPAQNTIVAIAIKPSYTLRFEKNRSTWQVSLICYNMNPSGDSKGKDNYH